GSGAGGGFLKRKVFFRIFPKGPGKKAKKIEGLPNPEKCF
ncbi:TusE/DsrC/DsvC family sulfur relay protein, partial [Escherichia coli]